jgi:hypothetical protein
MDQYGDKWENFQHLNNIFQYAIQTVCKLAHTPVPGYPRTDLPHSTLLSYFENSSFNSYSYSRHNYVYHVIPFSRASTVMYIIDH